MTGMLWHDKRKIEEAVTGAAEYYEGKYGLRPNVCHVNPAFLASSVTRMQIEDAKLGIRHTPLQGPLTISGIAIKADRTIQKECYWLGVI